MRLLKTALTFLFILSLLTGCSGEVLPQLITEEYLSPSDTGFDYSQTETVISDGVLGFSVWSHQLGGAEDAKEYAELLKENGFDTIDFSVLWADFEYDKDRYDWRFLDSVLDEFVSAGFKLNLSVVFWTYNLSFSEVLDLQKTASGAVYGFDNIRKSFLCLSSEKNLEYIENALLAFASHVYAGYGDSIVSWQIKLSELGELEYSSTVDLDYSDISYTAFLGRLKDSYGSISAFNTAYSVKYADWDAVEAEKKTVLTARCAYDWKLFKQETLIGVQRLAARVFRSVAPSVPVVFRLGTVGDSMSAVYRGIFDPYTVASESGSDIIQSDYFTDLQYNFYLDMMSGTTGKALSFEADGPWQGIEALDKTLTLADSAGKTGISSFSVANWTKSDINEYRDSYLSRYASYYRTEETRPEADSTEIIIINTLDFIIRQPPSSIYEIYKYAYKNMTGKSDRKVLFLTDTQIIADPSLLDGVKEIHLGGLNNVTYMYDALGDILANGKYALIDDDNQQPNFINEYSQPLDIDVQTILRARLENS